MNTIDPNCKECGGRGTVYRYIGHEGRAAVWPCKCATPPKK